MTQKEIEQTEIEAPYELPDGWTWDRLGNYITLLRGVSYKKDDAHSEKLENDCLIMRGGNIVEGSLNLESDNVYVDKSLVSENQLIQKYDIVIVTSTGSSKVIGRAGVAKDCYSDVAFGAFLTLARPNDLANKSYINHYFQSSLYRERIRQLASGVNINNIRSEYITETPIPLPPTLDEQERIVNRIETMFAKLDQAQEKAQGVLDSFETRKAAILHKAFSGQLRIDNKELTIEDWEDTKIGECLFPMTTKIPTGTTFRYIDIDAIDNKIQEVKTPKVLKVSEAPSRASRELKENDVLFSMVRPYLKNIAFIDKSLCDCIASTGFYVCRCKEKLSPLYLYNFLCSKDAIDYLMQFMKGDNSPSIRKDDLLSMPIKLPPLNYQLSIVNFLDSVLEKESRAKEAVQTVLDQIALLKKSILARAFRGEL